MDRKAQTDTDECATMTFHLKVDPTDDRLEGRGTKGLWAPSESSPGCLLTYKLSLNENSLTCTLTVNNTGSVAFPVQALFHTYYEALGNSALDGTKCNVKGLQGYELVDKVDASKSTAAITDEAVTVDGETDRVYNPPKDKPAVDVTIALNRPDSVQCHCKGSVDGSTVPVSCVVWNPHEAKAKAMGDFGDDQYHEMLCVEPGMLGEEMLQPGKEAVMEMVISVPM